MMITHTITLKNRDLHKVAEELCRLKAKVVKYNDKLHTTTYEITIDRMVQFKQTKS